MHNTKLSNNKNHMQSHNTIHVFLYPGKGKKQQTIQHKQRHRCLYMRPLYAAAYISDFPLKKGMEHIWRMRKGQLKKGRETIPLHNALYVFEAVAEKQHKTQMENLKRNKVKNEKEFKDFNEHLKKSEPHYLGIQELIEINKQLNKIKKKN